MSRILVSPSGEKLKVTEHIILKNFWEYYVLEAETNTSDVKLCLVMGAETEIGDVYLPEIKPYVISRTKKLENILPAPNYSWEH